MGEKQSQLKVLKEFNGESHPQSSELVGDVCGRIRLKVVSVAVTACPRYPVKVDKLDQCKLWFRGAYSIPHGKGKVMEPEHSRSLRTSAVSQVSDCQIICFC